MQRIPSERIHIKRGDIAAESSEAIVNAANTSLLGGGGVDGAIHRAAGPELLAECRTLKGCPTGQAKITKGYRLSAKWVIHTVGPVWSGGDRKEAELLAGCYQNALRLAESKGIRSVSFPSISTGAYRYPVREAARIACREILDFLNEHALPESVSVVCFDETTLETYRAALLECQTR